MAQSIIGDGGKLAAENGKMTARAMKDGGVARPAATGAAKTPKKAASRPKGLAFDRRFTHRGIDPLDEVTWERRSSVITNPDGSVVFKMEGAEIPAGWSQLATDIVVSKYFRKAGLHGKKEVGETSVRQVVFRLARTIREAGERFGGYFASAKDADTFEAELSYLLVHQVGAFNSPVWFNCGLFHRYGIEGSGGNFAWNEASADSGVSSAKAGSNAKAAAGALDEIVETANAYERPQCSACFIQAI